MKLKNIELTIATIVLLMAVCSLFGSVNIYLSDSYNSHSFNSEPFEAKGLPFNFFINYFLPFQLSCLSVYGAVIWVACFLPDRLIAQRQWGKALLTITGGWIVTCAIMVLKDYLLRTYHNHIVPESMISEAMVVTGIFFFILGYSAIKHLLIWLLKNDFLKSRIALHPVAFDVVWFVLLWGLALMGLIFFHPYWGFGLFIALMAPCIFIVYMVSLYWLIPRYHHPGHTGKFWLITFVVTFAVNIPFNGIFTAKATYYPFFFIIFFILFWLLQIVVILPLSLYIHKTRKIKAAELTALKTELGTSNANLQFLRSQINPHFLFNALNTLYGAALMEKAEKTGEGIQKLGDMMRFMLHENNQDKIALSHELDYLHNYIDLQNMRIAASPQVTIEIRIEEIIEYYEIAPMLLIPFIENAYKHGISLKEKSWINVNLFKQDNVLYLDVHNSVHPVNEHDPERYHSGTGLDNVKQRLQLIYPGRHQLVIRKNVEEFFIYLSLTLNTQNPV